jgi:two-component system, NtrC family, nitrogen regulation sensor histidine kinase NtrY
MEPFEPLTNKPPTADQSSEDLIGKKRKKTWQIIVAVFFSVILLTRLEDYFLKQGTTENITVLAIFNVLLILLFVLLILITRNLVKLYNERKSKMIGSKFQTKLIFAFLTLVLVPSLLLFFVASKLFSYSIGNWFSLQVEQSLKQTVEVAGDYYALLEEDAFYKARAVESLINANELYRKENRVLLNRFVSDKFLEHRLQGLIVFDNLLKTVVVKVNQTLTTNPKDLDFSDLIKKSVEGEGVSEIRQINGKQVLTVVLPLAQKIGKKVFIWGYVLSLSQISGTTAIKINKIRKTFEDYQKQSLLKIPVTANYYITFLMITLLILFSAIWLGFYMARGITVPIQQLAEGTRRIAGGDLNVKIAVEANDEIALLVDSFNDMMVELNYSRQEIQKGNEELKFTNIELDSRRNHIETILENIGAGVISINKKGRISTLNKAAVEILNIQNPDIKGRSYRNAFDLSYHDPIRDMIRRLSQDNKDTIEEQIELRVGDSNLTLLVKINALKDPGKKYLGLVVVFEDLTHMIKTQKLAAWREVAQGIAHEIKNPLTPIQLNTQRLRKKFRENKEDFARIFDDSIRIIDQEVEGMKELLEQFLRFSRLPAPNPQPNSLHKIIDNVSALYADINKNTFIKKNFDPNLNQINIDSEQFRRVFINLFDNAKDAIGEEGTIEVKTRLIQEKQIACIEFSDTGVGIPSTERGKLFMPYYTTKKRGTGLGLAIVHRIIVDHDGEIKARDNQPKGTTFIIEVPCVPSILHSSRLAKKEDLARGAGIF